MCLLFREYVPIGLFVVLGYFLEAKPIVLFYKIEYYSEYIFQNLVDYYYTWKTTDRYVQQKRLKAAEHETKLKQVYVPDYSKHGKHTASGV